MNYVNNKIVLNGKIILVIESFVEWKSHFYKLSNILWYAIDGIKVSCNFVPSFYILSMLHDDAKIGVTLMLVTDVGDEMVTTLRYWYPFWSPTSTIFLHWRRVLKLKRWRQDRNSVTNINKMSLTLIHQHHCHQVKHACMHSKNRIVINRFLLRIIKLSPINQI